VPSEKLEEQKQNLAALRLHLGKLNRSIASMQRQIDEVPARAELAQYQKRFLELYTQGKLFKSLLISLSNILEFSRQLPTSTKKPNSTTLCTTRCTTLTLISKRSWNFSTPSKRVTPSKFELKLHL